MKTPKEVALAILSEMVGHIGKIERESNKKHGRSDGTQAGPDPEVQRELKNQGILHRIAARRKKMLK